MELTDPIVYQGSERLYNPAKLYTVLFPLNHNDDRPMEPERLHKAQNELMHFAGGYTRCAPATGLWINPRGQAKQDLVLPVQVVVSQGNGSNFWVAEWALRAARLFDQEEIFLFAQDVWRFGASNGS